MEVLSAGDGIKLRFYTAESPSDGLADPVKYRSDGLASRLSKLAIRVGDSNETALVFQGQLLVPFGSDSEGLPINLGLGGFQRATGGLHTLPESPLTLAERSIDENRQLGSSLQGT